MAVGAQTTQAQTNSVMTQLAVQLRELANDIIQQGGYLNKLGVAGLEALGYSAADAQAVLDNINHMTTVAQVYKGTATQADAFPFEDYLTPLWAGQ